MTSLLPIPELQFFTNDGVPLAGGTIQTYTPSTLTPKATWQDAGQVAANTNPIVLDSAGRGLIYGAGSYRFIVSDSLGNLVYDQETSSYLSETAISPAMLPVTQAATIPTAVSLLGIPALINAAVAAIELMPGTAGTPGATGPTGPAGPAGGTGGGYAPTLQASNNGYVKFPNMNGGATNLFIQWGGAVSNSGGTVNVTFPTPFPTICWAVVACNTDSATGSWWVSTSIANNSSFNAITSSPLHGGTWQGGPIGFQWFAVGV